MKRRNKGHFLQAFLVFQLVLILVISACLIYVHRLLNTYEESQPERLVEAAIINLTQKAEDKELFKDSLPSTEGTLEAGIDLSDRYYDLISDSETRFAAKAGLHEADELVYSVKTGDGFPLAEVTLEAVGEPQTRLAVFTWQEWQLKSVTPILEAKSYTLTVPKGFTVTVNGTTLSAGSGVITDDDDISYTFDRLYFRPKVEIISKGGEKAGCTFKGEKIVPSIYDYHLTLPSSLSLTLNGNAMEGVKADNGYTTYDICLVSKPEVTISDLYGNTVNYEGGNTLPITYLTVEATDSHRVTVNGTPVPQSAITYKNNPDYEPFAAYVSGLPTLATFDIAVLQDEPDIVITSANGETVTWENGTRTLDVTEPSSADTLPDSIAAEVDPLAIAKKWSLFVSKDLPGQNYGLYDITQYLIPNSYQYNIAVNYAYGIDITFTSIHTLMDPPFTDESVTNFVMITDNCFSVDVSFKKHMMLSNGALVDAMTERLYFVKYDDPSTEWDTPAWKLASMKEMSTNAE